VEGRSLENELGDECRRIVDGKLKLLEGKRL
jgi:hypothetical protein